MKNLLRNFIIAIAVPAVLLGSLSLSALSPQASAATGGVSASHRTQSNQSTQRQNNGGGQHNSPAGNNQNNSGNSNNNSNGQNQNKNNNNKNNDGNNPTCGNDVMYQGASSPDSVVHKYNNGDGCNSAASIQAIYSAFGIGNADIQALGSNSKNGSVTASGDVYVDGKVVATNAQTAGRQDISGSTRHSNQGTVFYTRPPKTSFQSNNLSAFVVMKNGVFQFAILSSCGNPVIGQAKPVQTAPTQNQPTKPVPQGHINNVAQQQPAKRQPAVTQNVCNGDTANANTGVAAQGGNCSSNTVNNTTNTTTSNSTAVESTAPAADTNVQTQATPAAADTSVQQTAAPAEQTEAPAETEATEAPQTTPASGKGVLPNTGPGAIIGIFTLATIAGAFGYRKLLQRYL